MTHLLRKIFFWDAPEQGAFFGLTLLLFLVWCCFSLICACLVIHSRIFWFVADSPCNFILMGLILLLFLYVLFIVLKVFVNMVRRTPCFWKRLLKMLAAVVVLTPFCALFAFCLLPHPPTMVALAFQTAFCLAFFGLGYLFRPIVHPAKLLPCLLCWTGAFLVFSTLLCQANPLIDKTDVGFNWSGHYFPYVMPFWRWFNLFGNGCFWFTLAGFLMLAIAYYLSWSILAKMSGSSMCRFCSRGIRVQWIIMAGIYAVTLCFALWSNAQYHAAVKDLEVHFGHPMTGVELGHVYYDGRTPDADYWKRLEAAMDRYHQEHEKTVETIDDEYGFTTYNDNELTYRPDTILPKDLYDKCKAGFLNSLSSSELLEFFVSPMPPGERDYSAKWLIGMTSSELFKCRELARMEHRRCLYAIDSGDFKTAAETVAHLDILCDFLNKECSDSGYLVGMVVGGIRNEMLAKLLDSGLPPDKWLEEQSNQLLQLEERFEEHEKMILYSEAVIGLDALQFVVVEHLKGQEESENWGYWIYYKSIRFFFPQEWWLMAKSARDYARAMKATTFDQFPKKATGSVLVDMFCSSLNRGGEKKRYYIASCRILRGLIAAELQKRRTGTYPDSLDVLPLDPFSSQPLKYRKGVCQVSCYFFERQTDEKAESEIQDDDDIEIPPHWERKTKQENVNAVQIWSVGLDGIDDGGLNFRKEDDSNEERKDDIRFIIQMR